MTDPIGVRPGIKTVNILSKWKNMIHRIIAGNLSNRYTVISAKNKQNILLILALTILCGMQCGCVVYVRSKSNQDNSKKYQKKKVMKQEQNQSKQPLNGGSRKIVNWNNYQQSKGEINLGQDMFIPDQAYTIEEIFDKFTRGISIDELRSGHYSDSEDFNDVDILSMAKDPVELEELVQERNQRKKQTKKLEKPILKEEDTDSDKDPVPDGTPLEATP